MRAVANESRQRLLAVQVRKVFLTVEVRYDGEFAADQKAPIGEPARVLDIHCDHFAVLKHELDSLPKGKLPRMEETDSGPRDIARKDVAVLRFDSYSGDRVNGGGGQSAVVEARLLAAVVVLDRDRRIAARACGVLQ